MGVTMSKSQDSKPLSRAREVIETLRSDMDPQVPAHVVMAFMEIADSMPQGISQDELRKRIGLSKSAIDRNTDTLGKFKDRKLNVPGYLLVEEHTPEDNRKIRVWKLTKKGEKLVEKLRKLLE